MIGIIIKVVGAVVSIAVPWVTAKWGPEVGTAVAAVGGAVLSQTKPIARKK